MGNLAVALVGESSGQYVYFAKAIFNGPSNAKSVFLDTFKVDAIKPALVPLSSQTLQLAGTFVAAVSDPNGHGLTICVNQDQGGANPVPVLYTITFDPVTGLANLPASGTGLPGIDAKYMSIDPKGKFLVANYGQNSDFFAVFQLSTTNFQILTSNTFQIANPVPGLVYGHPFFFDPSGGILYVEFLHGTNPGDLHLFDTTTLLELPSSPLSIGNGNFACGPLDRYGPFAYCENTSTNPSSGISGYQIDPITGVSSQPGPLSAPFYPNLSISPGILTATASQQNSSTPALAESPASLAFPQTQTGQTSAPMVVTVKNIGNLLASFTSIAISGPNSSDFAKSSDSCTTNVILQPNHICTVSLTYSPANTGTSQATLVITDDAAGSPQKIALSGTAVAPPPPVPVVSLNPSGTLNFPGTTTQGTSSAPQNIILTNTGNGPLHVTGLAVNGFNANDFVVGTSNCVGTVVAPGANCTIPVTFAPLAAGIRTTTLDITDDATGSPQPLTLSGTATPAITPSVPTAQNVAAGQTAAYPLTLTPGAGYSGTVSLICTGAPLGATCSVPASVPVTNGMPAAFKVTVKTSGPNHAVLPFSNWPRFTPISQWPMLSALALLLMALLAFSNWSTRPRAKRLAWSSAFATIVMFMTFSVAGCGGAGGAPPPPPPVVTPPGTFTLTVTPAATSPSGQPLQLPTIQLTLTVTQ